MVRSNRESLLGKSLLINVALSVVVLALVILLLYNTIIGNHGQSSGAATTTLNTQVSGSSNQTQKQTSALVGINQPLNASQLAVINNEPLSYYEIAGEKLLNGTLTNQVETTKYAQYNALIINGKPSVIYVGAITCPYCGENRWAMQLALAKFGNFTALYKGYSSLSDGDVPTLYFSQVNYTTPAGVDFRSSYRSNLINFFSAEYESPLTQGFQVQPISYFIAKAPDQANATALSFMDSTGKFQGTPFTFWGTSLVTGADAVIFGNSSQSQSMLNGGETHNQILYQLQNFNDQLAYSEYAAADVYIAQVCPSINDSAPVCNLPAIQKIRQLLGL